MLNAPQNPLVFHPLEVPASTPNTPVFVASYLSATARRDQPLCGNKEGWGPLSPHRWDFTPCFLDVLEVGVAVGGIVLGACAIWYILQKDKEIVKKNWHFWAKLVCTTSNSHRMWRERMWKLTPKISRY
jgi:ATP-binding cassette, subfamily C (CFTR/MRP), member 1